MNIRYGLATVALVAGLGGGSAFAGTFLDADSAYVGVGAGGNFLQDQDLTKAPVGAGLKADPGFLGAGTLGIRWASGWRAEIEGAYRQNDFKVLAGSGTVSGTSAMLNAIRDIDLGGPVTPYVGFGAGYLFTDYDHAGAFVGGDDFVAALQGILGMSIAFSPRLEGFADYRYFSSAEKQDVTGDYYTAHELMVGIRYTFWEAPKPVAAAPPPPPPASKDYVIYFEFNKSNITPAAGAVLDEVKTTVAGKPVSVVGHTDTVGSMKYNQGLSERRASSTGKALVKRGVKVEAESGRSFSEPAVNTGPGVKEPLNRRAVIKVDSGAGM